MPRVPRPSHPALLIAREAIRQTRDRLVSQWTGWVIDRMGADPRTVKTSLDRQFGLLVDILIQLAGPLRREGAELWFSACDSYGRLAAIRGLAAGEVVEEIQHLRELLIRHLSERVFNLSPRQAMAVVLRLNRILDKGIAHAVVGYTDALVETLFERSGVPVAASEPPDLVIEERLRVLEDELGRLRARADA